LTSQTTGRKESRWTRPGERRSLPGCCSSSPSSPRSQQRYVTARLVECTFIAIGIVSLLAVVTLRQDFAAAAGGDPSAFVAAGRSLVAVHDWTFLLGPGWVVGVGNGLILGWLMYRSGLVPRGMAVLGLVAGPVLLAGGTAALLGVIEPDSALKNLAAGPEFVWELSLGIYLMVKGFRSSGVQRLQADRRVAPTSHEAAVSDPAHALKEQHP
jgi:Domain of unknown function (DUF4386)